MTAHWPKPSGGRPGCGFSRAQGDFETTAAQLKTAGLACDERDGQFILLVDGVATEQVVRYLVGHNIPVHEIAPHEETLEDFYLTLMKSNPN